MGLGNRSRSNRWKGQQEWTHFNTKECGDMINALVGGAKMNNFRGYITVLLLICTDHQLMGFFS